MCPTCTPSGRARIKIHVTLVPKVRFVTILDFQPEEFNSPPRGIFLSTLGRPISSLDLDGWMGTELDTTALSTTSSIQREMTQLHQKIKKLDIQMRPVSTNPCILSFSKKTSEGKKTMLFSLQKKAVAFLAKASYFLFFWESHGQVRGQCMRFSLVELCRDFHWCILV